MKFLVLVGIAACSSKPPDHLLHTMQTKDHTTIVGDHVDLATLPFTDWIEVPAHGTANIKIDVATPGGDLRQASGTIEIACVGVCGLGGTTVHVGKGAFAGDLQIPSVDFDRIDVAATIQDGHATITRWNMAGKDVEIVASGKLTFAQRLADSTIDACLRFRGTPGLRDRDPKLDAILETTGAPAAADGFFNIRLTDRLSSMRRLGSICDGSAPPPAPPTAPQLADTGSAAPIDDAALAKQIEAAVTPRADGADVDAKALAKLLEDPITLARGARLVPAIDQGKAVGFKLYAVAKTSLFARLGLQTGDVVASVNGRSIASADQALEVYTSLSKLNPGDTVTLEITRDGAPRTLMVHLR